MSLRPRNNPAGNGLKQNEFSAEAIKRNTELCKIISDLMILETKGTDTFIDIMAVIKNNLTSIPGELNFANKMLNVFNLIIEYCTLSNYVKLLEKFLQPNSGNPPIPIPIRDIASKCCVYFKKLTYPMIYKKEHSFKKFAGHQIYFFYTLESEYFILNSHCVEFKAEFPFLEFDQVIIPYMDKDIQIVGNLYYFYIPHSQPLQKYLQRIKKETLLGQEQEYQHWCNFSINFEDMTNTSSSILYVKGANFTNKLDKYFECWNDIAITTMIPCKSLDSGKFSAIIEVIEDKFSCYKRLHVRSNGLTINNKDCAGNLTIETLLIAINQNTTYEINIENEVSLFKIQTDNASVEIRLHNNNDTEQLENLLSEYKQSFDIFKDKLVISVEDTFKCNSLLQKAVDNPYSFFESITSSMF